MAGLPNSSNALQQWHHLFEAEGAKRSPQAQQHLQQLLRTGLPTRKHENWKYTPLDGLTNSQFVSIAGEISPQQRDALALTLDAVRLVFVDGRYVPALSDATEGSGYEVSINDDRQGLPDAIQAEVFLHLTESLAQSVTHIAVKRGQRPAKPLLLMHITQGVAGEEVNTAHYRHHLDLAEGAEATVIEHFVSLNDARHSPAHGSLSTSQRTPICSISSWRLKIRSVTTLLITICCWLTMPPHLATVSCWVAQCYDTTPVRNSMAKTARCGSIAWRCR